MDNVLAEQQIVTAIILAPKTPAPGTPERKTYDRVRKQESRERQKQSKQAESYKYTSTNIPTKPEAIEVLEQRIQNLHVVNVAYDLGVLAAERHGIPANRFFWANGLQQTLKSKDQRREQPLELDHAAEVDGELVSRGDLFGLFDYSISWREQITFEEFLKLRHVCKTDAFELGLVLGKDFHEKPHGTWRDFFPQFQPTLKAGYSQEEMKQWLDQQSLLKDRLLMASRNAYKSSWNVVWLLTAVLCCPDIRLLLVSETSKLSKGFIRGFRNYWEIANKREPTKFQQLFPEYMIPAGDGSTLAFESPMRHLNLIQETAAPTSLESTVAGQRADIIVYDDPISNLNTANEESCEKGVQTFDAIQKLREVGGYSVVIGTPWAPTDLYAKLIERAAQDPESLIVKIDPAWTVKDHAKRKPILQLTEDDVDLLFPSRLTFKFLQKELKTNPAFFLSQNLCQFPQEADAQLKVTFTEDQLKAALRNIGTFDRAQTIYTVIAVDPAFSISRFADFSCIACLRIVQDTQTQKTICFVTDVFLDRLKQSELALKIVEMIQKHGADRAVIEKTGPWLDLQAYIQREARNRGQALPYIHWKQIQSGAGIGGPSVKSKAARIKGLELLLAEGRLLFAMGPWNDIVFGQFIKFDGVTKSNISRKDDAPDCIASGCETYLPRYTGETPTEAQQKSEEEAYQQEIARMQYSRMFGTDQGTIPVAATPESEPQPGGILGTLGRFGLVRQ
jgi:hypothetical protein